MQRKLPEPLRQALESRTTTATMVDPHSLAKHFSGEQEYISSGVISLPRPLAPTYVKSIYERNDLLSMEALVEAEVGFYNCAELLLTLQPEPRPEPEPEETSFARSPSPPRRRPRAEGGT